MYTTAGGRRWVTRGSGSQVQQEKSVSAQRVTGKQGTNDCKGLGWVFHATVNSDVKTSWSRHVAVVSAGHTSHKLNRSGHQTDLKLHSVFSDCYPEGFSPLGALIIIRIFSIGAGFQGNRLTVTLTECRNVDQCSFKSWSGFSPQVWSDLRGRQWSGDSVKQ